MKNATVAKNSGQSTCSRPSNDDRDIIFRWKTQPRNSSLTVFTRASLVAADERHVGVLERRLARGDAADLGAVQVAEHRRRQLDARIRLDQQELGLLAVLDRDVADAA